MTTSRASRLCRGLLLSSLGTSLACASPDSGMDAGADTPSPPLCTAVAHTCASFQAAFAGSAVSIACTDGDPSVRLTASGLPPYPSCQVNLAKAQDWELTLPLQSRCLPAPQSLEDGEVAMGLLWNGVAVYPARSLDGETYGAAEVNRRDLCGGATGNGCAYAYRGASACTFGDAPSLSSRNEADGHGAVVGWLVDGFPLYSDALGSGEPGLDACNGHETATRGDHYHAAASDLAAPPCLVGRDRADLRFTAVLPSSCTRAAGTGGGDGGRSSGGADAGSPGTGGGPPSCNTPADCTVQKCPPGSQGCTCIANPAGASICVTTCTVAGDCPTGNGLPTFQCMSNHCAPV